MDMESAVTAAVEVLKKGGLILYPTDTVWGIGCDATNAAAVARIYALKGDAQKKSMLVLVENPDEISRYIHKVPEVAWQLLEVANKPLTLILPRAAGVAENLIPEEGTLGMRIPNHAFCKALLRRLRRPLVSTSANLSGKPSPMNFSEISSEVREGVDLVVDPTLEGDATRKPSSLISVGEGGEIQIIRP